jgi:hypothetical protein
VLGQTVDTGCAALSGVTVHAVSLDGSIAMFDQKAPCTDGQMTIPMLQSGTYGAVVYLEDLNGARITTATLDNFQITAGQVFDAAAIDFELLTSNSGNLLGRWTINGASAATACAGVGANDVFFHVLTGPMMMTSTTSAPCRNGQAKLLSLLPGLYDVEFKLRDQTEVTITSTTVHNVVLHAASNATISVDLRP